MMHRLFGLVLAGGLVLGYAAVANAQVSFSIGNPYTGGGISVGTPYYGGYGGYGYPYGGAYGPAAYGYSSYYAAPTYGTYVAPLYGTTTYSSGYSGYVAPGTTYYNSGYYGAYPARSFYSPSSIWMGAPRPASVWMGGGIGGGWRGGRVLPW